MTGRLRLSLSGPFRAVTADGVPVEGISVRGQLLLSYLATRSGQRATREELAALLWGDRGEDQARASLRQELSVLRRLLPDETLSTDRTEVALDAERVEDSRDGAGDPFLAGLAVRSPAAEDWLRDMRLRDISDRVDRAIGESAGLLAQNDAEAAARAARRALSLDPCSEHALRAAMRAEDAAGNRSGALALFEQARARIAADLDAEPDGETVALAARLRARAQPASDLPRRTAADRPILAVLPFDELGAAQEDMFADGVVEEITGALSRVRDFDVIARQSAFALRGQGLDHAGTAARLSASYLVEGSVRRSRDRVRIAVQLVDGSDGRTLWSERFDDRMDDLFDLQDRIAAQVAGRILPSVRTEEIARAGRRPVEDRTAYDLMLTALPHFWALRREDNARAIALLNEATRRDPGFLTALALQAWAMAQQTTYMWSADPAQDRARALDLADLAAASVADHAPTLVAIAGTYSQAGHDPLLAQTWIDRALHLDPNNAWAWIRKGWLHQYLREVDASLAAFDRAERLSPLDPFLHQITFGRAAAHYRWADDPTEGLRMIEEGLRRHPGVLWPLRMAAVANVRLGNLDRAQAAAARLLAELPHVTIGYLRACLPPIAVHFDDGYYDDLAKAGIPE